MRATASTYITVTIVAFLIWWWAAGATSTSRLVTVSVFLEAPQGMTLLPGPIVARDQKITITGPAAEVDRAAAEIWPELRLQLGRNGLPKDPGEHELSLEEALDLQLGHYHPNVTFDAVDKDGNESFIPFRLDNLIRQDYIVQVSAPGIEMDGPPTVTPREARVTIPEHLLTLLGSVHVQADVRQSDLEQAERGGRFIAEAPLRLYGPNGPVDPNSPGLIIQPTNATVSFRVAGRTATVILGEAGSGVLGVPVQIALPAGDTSRYEVSIDPKDAFLRNVRLTGASEGINAVRDGRFKVLAFVQLTSDDLDRAVLDGGVIVRPITMWALPPGVTVQDPGKTDYQLEQERLPDRAPRDGIRVIVKRRAVE